MSIRFRDRVHVVVRRILGLGAALYDAVVVEPPAPDVPPPTQTGVPGGTTSKPKKPAKRPFLYYPYVQEPPDLAKIFPFLFPQPQQPEEIAPPEPAIFAKPLPYEITQFIEQEQKAIEIEAIKNQARRARRRLQIENDDDMKLRLLLLLDY